MSDITMLQVMAPASWVVGMGFLLFGIFSRSRRNAMRDENITERTAQPTPSEFAAVRTGTVLLTIAMILMLLNDYFRG
ncbi:MAG TPA: hypothetical protein DC063_08225 [Arenimonas sp.]|nr:MAG: hypothetical protein A2X76_11245 [Xanthomonadales bacterium GWF1_69_6]HBD20061.1 hypothetical protein [Arenimonas sp.]